MIAVTFEICFNVLLHDTLLGWFMVCPCIHMSLCLSVRLSLVINQCSVQMAKLSITQTMLCDSPRTLWFSDAKDLGEIVVSSFPLWATNTGG